MTSDVKSEIKLKDENFTIVSNNCLGGYIYQYYNIEYRTPTLGLFMLAKDYIKFLTDIKGYLSTELEFINVKDSMYYEEYKSYEDQIKFPIAKLQDIEIFFMHYKDKEEVVEKWYRRIKKINWSNLIVVMAENETFNYDVLKEFDKLPFVNKICFTRDEYKEIKSSCYINGMKDNDILWTVEEISKNFNLTDFINNREIQGVIH
ncbi:DUF1919 domain-containing protein [Clostridium sp.]|uniref:DUF1919 domain-containing protein n=1 Tax=Clostridium sp. TaxID=1506 RepID=UPI001D9856D5|nr:DUF1919 domain-containing protein [Clostridium sp.]MBS5938618.1 DUF1919 domain-containing protein [Clostridium sp.]